MYRFNIIIVFVSGLGEQKTLYQIFY